MPGFSPTQGHIASAIPFLDMRHDRRPLVSCDAPCFLAKGQSVPGANDQMSDGLSSFSSRNGPRVISLFTNPHAAITLLASDGR